jgi:hypothetical protein
MDMVVKQPRRRGSRSPVGVDMQHRVAVALFPEERTRLEAVAAKDSRAVSAMARVLILRAMEQMEKEAVK